MNIDRSVQHRASIVLIVDDQVSNIIMLREDRDAVPAATSAASDQYVLAIDAAFQRYEYALRGARGAIVVAGPALSRTLFQRYSATRDYAREFPGARGFGYTRRVAPQQGAHAGARYVVQYRGQAAGNGAALGLDTPLVTEEVLAGTGARPGRQADAGRRQRRSRHAVFQQRPAAPGVAVQRDHAVYGRTWRLRVAPPAALVRALRPLSVGHVWMAGAADSGVLALRAGGRRRPRSLVQHQARLAAIVASSLDAIIGKTLQAALRENDVLVRTINQQLLYAVTDAHGAILKVNDNFCSASGYRREDLLGKNHRLLGSGQHDTGYWQGLWFTLGAGTARHGEMCNRARDGSLALFDTVIAPYCGANGESERCVALRTDVTAPVAGAHVAIYRKVVQRFAPQCASLPVGADHRATRRFGAPGRRGAAGSARRAGAGAGGERSDAGSGQPA